MLIAAEKKSEPFFLLEIAHHLENCIEEIVKYEAKQLNIAKEYINPISILRDQTNDDRRDVGDGGNVADATGSVHDGDGDDTDARGEMVSLRFATILLLALLTVSVTTSDWWDDDWDEPWHQYHHHHHHGHFPHQHFHHHSIVMNRDSDYWDAMIISYCSDCWADTMCRRKS
ncbi:HISTIDINE-RICH TRANSPORTER TRANSMEMBRANE PROTEIN, putative [Brugia malayi]|uniref:HISTIDINE-RICH TRANSPORTER TRANSMEMBRANE PROTEIN, putative n=1 Tax=Brugia malayi TaxID=6279 RepID=A0A4E9F7G1_BRUMA|nr:HISTIDINE-RICH TRANSPORTER TRANSMEMBRANE PROTEIN, putative [Brugia malayi]VIO92097.1 HISTIDINE-RICH TRANSPORTER TRANSMEMBRANE PROTEIN, putative [Brugia malayi]